MFRAVLAAPAVFLAVVTAAPPARAEFVLAAGVAGNTNIGSNVVRLPTSWSFTGMVGVRFDLGPLELTPELELTFHDSFQTLGNDEADRVFQVMGGGRVGLALGMLVPSAYVHFGLGNVHLNDGSITRTENGPSVEVGGALDLRLIPLLAVGVQVGYVDVSLSALQSDRQSIQWVRFGARATLSF